jgi:hypothetical protein
MGLNLFIRALYSTFIYYFFLGESYPISNLFFIVRTEPGLHDSNLPFIFFFGDSARNLIEIFVLLIFFLRELFYGLSEHLYFSIYIVTVSGL